MWNKLSMTDRAKYIKLAIENGITDLNTIRDTYNSYEEGGNKDKITVRTDLEKELQKEYGYLYDQYPAHVIQDNSYMKVPGSDNYGTIETMLKEDAWYPDINYRYSNPYPGEDTIVFNDNTPNAKNAVILDYLHVLRENSPEYNRALEGITKFATAGDNDLNRAAKAEYKRQKDAGVTPQSMDKLIANQVDGWLRNMFHPGTSEEMERDRYYPDKRQLLEWTPELVEPTREVYNFLHPYTLPEVTVTPKGNLKRKGGGNKIRKFGDGGKSGEGEKLLTTGNDYVDTALSFVPIVGTAMDIEEAVRNPSLGNIGIAALSVATDLFGGSLIRGAVKTANKAAKATKAIKEAEKAEKVYNRALHNATVNSSKKLNKRAGKAYREMKKAQAARDAVAPVRGVKGVNRVPRTINVIPTNYKKIINPYTVYGMDALINAAQQYNKGSNK